MEEIKSNLEELEQQLLKTIQSPKIVEEYKGGIPENLEYETVKKIIFEIGVKSHTLESFTLEEALMQAVGYNQVGIAGLLIDQGARVDLKVAGNPVLNIAIHMPWHYSMVKLLVRKGADVNKKDCTGRTPLMLVSTGKRYYMEVLQLLLENKADIQVLNHRTSLMMIEANNPEIIRIVKDAIAKE